MGKKTEIAIKPSAEVAKPKAEAVPEPAVEEIEPEPLAVPTREVTFVLDPLDTDSLQESDEDDPDDDDHEDEGDHEDELLAVVGQLTQLMMTEQGEAITDVLGGIREALDKQNKILYRGLQLLEQRSSRR